MPLTGATTSSRAAVLADAIALTAFIVGGVGAHSAADSIEVFARNALPIGGAWVGVALLVGAYRPASLRRLLATWAIALPLGVVARTWWTGSWDRFGAFLGVAAGITLVFLLAGRAVATAVGSMRRAKRAR